jgi:hypothetical protein
MLVRVLARQAARERFEREVLVPNAKAEVCKGPGTKY